jgi:nucleotide-binding universal stress UspA family protein
VYIDRKRKGRGSDNAMNTILVPVDFSDCSLGGLDYAIEFAKAFGARVLLLHVMDLGPLLGSSDYTRYGRQAFENAMALQAHEDMRAFVRRANFRGLLHQTIIVAGGIVERICDVARTENADLIITSTHGRVGLSHLLIGSTAELTVRYAPCPVLAVPSYPEARVANLRKPQTAKRPVRRTPRKRLLKSATTRRARKLMAQPFPERRMTNKFREMRFRSSRVDRSSS